jgi:adenylate cyclase
VVQDMACQKLLSSSVRAVLVVDVVESVRLIEQDEEGVIARWLSLVNYVEADLLAAGEGRLVKYLGDGMLLAFADVRVAVSAALAIQHASKRQNFGVPPERQILLRIGIEITDVIIEGHDVYGHGVNLATRLASIAGPGEIVISAQVRDQITPILDADIEDLGDCFLKHVQHPVRAYRIGRRGRLRRLGAPPWCRRHHTVQRAHALEFVRRRPLGKWRADPPIDQAVRAFILVALPPAAQGL